MIEDKLQGKNSRDKARIKSEEISKLDLRGKFSDPNSNIKIEITDHEQIEDGIQVFAKAWRGTRKVGFGKDGTVEIERFRIFNPPVLVDDENGDIVREWDEQLPKSDTVTKRSRKLRYDPVAAITGSLFHTVGLVGKSGSNIIKGKIGNTTSTFYPAAGANSPVDGLTQRRIGINESWAAITSGAGDDSSDTGTEGFSVYVSASTTTDQWDWLERSIYLFDTSTIADSDTVDSATLSFYSGFASVDNFSESISIVSANPASNSALVNADYSTTGNTKYATDITIASWNTSGYNDYTLNATGIAAIDTTGISKFGQVLSGDADDSSPTWSSGTSAGVRNYYADETGTSKDPKLVVTHTQDPDVNSYSTDLEKDSSQYWSITDASQTGLDLTGNFTIEYWCKPETFALGYSAEPISKQSSSTNGYIVQQLTSGVVRFVRANTTAHASTVTALPLGEWSHVAFTYDGTDTRCYVNGELRDTQTMSALDDTSANFQIGVSQQNSTRYYDGLLDDVRVWSDERTADEILENMQTELNGDEANLVGYWKFNADGTDTTSNSNDLTNNNSATFSADVAFNPQSTDIELSSSQYWSIANADQVGLKPDDVTVECWIKPESIPGAGVYTFADAGNGGGAWTMFINSSGNVVARARFTGDTDATSTTTLSAGTWYHAAMTVNDTTKEVKVFINGTEEDSTTGSGTYSKSTADITFGARSTGAGNYYDGLIDDVRVWDDIRTDAEIDDNKCSTMTGTEANLVGYWRFDGQGVDQSGNGNLLTNNNSATFSTEIFTDNTAVCPVATDAPALFWANF